jgi:hypothetical protein
MKCFIASHIVTFKIIVQFYEFFSKSYLLYFLLILLYLICSFHIFTNLFHTFHTFYWYVFTSISHLFLILFVLCYFSFFSDSLLVQIVTTKIQTFLQKKEKNFAPSIFFLLYCKKKICAIYFCLHQNKF